MHKKQKRMNWDKPIQRFLQISLGTLLLVLAVASIFQILAPIIIGARSAYSNDAWLGFWGNLLGGTLGLAGGLVAAYAAVRAVERQLQHAENDRKLSSKHQLEAYTALLFQSIKSANEDADNLEAALAANDLNLVLRFSSGLFLTQQWVDDSLRAEWQSRVPVVAARLTSFMAMLEQHKKALARARQFIASGGVKSAISDLDTATHLLRVTSTSALVLTTSGSLCAAMALELDSLGGRLSRHTSELISLSARVDMHRDRLFENFVGLGGNPDTTFL